MREPSASPPPSKAQLATVRIAEGEELLDVEASEEAAAEAERRRREREAAAQALTLEMMGDLPFAEVKPPENVLFVCKLNPVTTDEDLELIFSRFGKILSCEVIRDQKTGDSLQYAFIEFEDKKSCEEAYSKMDSVLIDDRRIHVDFSQSVSKLSDVWRSETNSKRKSAARRGGGGGWGGVDELEKWRKYRDEDVEWRNDDSYQMVHGVEDLKGRHDGDKPPARDSRPDVGGGRDRSMSRRSRSPRRDRDRRDDRDNRRGLRDADRRRDDRDSDRRDRRGDRSRDRYRDRDHNDRDHRRGRDRDNRGHDDYRRR